MQVTIHASQQTEPFVVEGRRFFVRNNNQFCTDLSIRQPSDTVVDGLVFILRDSKQLRQLIGQMSEIAHRLEDEEMATPDEMPDPNELPELPDL